MALELDDDVFRRTLERGARRSKVQINVAELVTVLRADSTLVIAPISDFDDSPATDLPGGVNSAFAYIDNPRRGIGAGFYTLRITAGTVEVGNVTGTLEYVDQHGEVALSTGALVEIESITVPSQPAFPHAVINLGGVDEDQHPRSLAAGGVQADEVVIVCCPNGYCWFEKQ